VTVQITITSPGKGDVDAQASSQREPARLIIAGVEIITPCQTLEEAERSEAFLTVLEEAAGRQRHRLQDTVAALRHQRIVSDPDSFPEEEVSAALAREYSHSKYMIFYHGDSWAGPRTVWEWGTDTIVHYDPAADESKRVRFLPLDPRKVNIVGATAFASSFGPIITYAGQDDDPDIPGLEAA
jgi:hypothetical protein